MSFLYTFKKVESRHLELAGTPVAKWKQKENVEKQLMRNTTENLFYGVMVLGWKSVPWAQRPCSRNTSHTGPSVIPSRGMLGALSAVGLSSFFSEVGTWRLTYGL